MTGISISRFRRSFGHAIRGFQRALATENSFRIHVVVALCVSIALCFLRLDRIDTAFIIFVMATILVLELVNTVVERFVGLLEPRVHPYVGVIKDLMAAAVLVMTLAAIAIGALLLSSRWS
jgi:diacylglycerol kinase